MEFVGALNAIVAKAELFGAEQLCRLEPDKIKSLKLPNKLAYFQGGTSFHRIAIVCPTGKDFTHLQQLLAGLIWANRVSNGQKTIVYLVGEGFSPLLGQVSNLFGPRVEVRFAYYTPKLSQPFLVSGKTGRVAIPEFSLPQVPDLAYWKQKFNPVEKGWFTNAIGYFQTKPGLDLCFGENWVSVKFQGLEVVRIGKKENRLRIALITRYPRERAGTVAAREEKEGWFNATGQLNAEFTIAFEERLRSLSEDRDLLARICSEKQRLQYLLGACPSCLQLDKRLFFNLDVSKKGYTTLEVEVLAENLAGNLVTAVVHAQKDLTGLAQCLEQYIWAKTQFKQIKRIYFGEHSLGEPEAWLISPANKVHPDLEVIKSLLWPEECIKIRCINEDWWEKGILSSRTC